MISAIDIYKRDVDRTLLRENLRLTPQQRFEKYERFMKSVMALREAGQRHRRMDSDARAVTTKTQLKVNE